MDNHKACKAVALRRLWKATYALDELRCMKADNCPSVSALRIDSLNKLIRTLTSLRRKIL
jgi:hypothetical protein